MSRYIAEEDPVAEAGGDLYTEALEWAVEHGTSDYSMLFEASQSIVDEVLEVMPSADRRFVTLRILDEAIDFAREEANARLQGVQGKLLIWRKRDREDVRIAFLATEVASDLSAYAHHFAQQCQGPRLVA
jgi:hypothetical protein